MYDLIYKHKRIVQVILALITLPFAFFGVDYYFRRNAGPDTVATVGDDKVTQADFDEVLRDQQERMRQALGRNYDPALFDTPEARYALVDQLVNQRLLESRARAGRLRVTDPQLYEFIAQVPVFQVAGKFSPDRYKEVLQSQGRSPLQFEQQVRGELILQPLQEPLVNGNIVARTSTERYLSLLEQQREVAVATMEPDAFAKSVKVDEAQIKAYYDQNPKAFETPEQAKIEYVTLTPDALAPRIKVDPAEVKQAYDTNQRQYGTPEERQAAHILIAVKPDAKDEDKEAAKKKAEALLTQAKANPAKFAELAKANSQDPGSASQGGDLGSFGRGSMVKPFEDAVFGAKVGDIVGPVRTEFGYHVIKVTGITPSHMQSFDDVKGQIEADLKRQKAQQTLASDAEKFQNLVYEQADSLEPVAKALNLKVETTQFLARPQIQAIGLGNPKFVAALFSPESIQTKRNTEAIEVAPNVLISGRIVEYKPATPRPFAEVAEDIRKLLTQKAAAELAQKAGMEKLAALESGKPDSAVGLTFGKTVTVKRDQQQGDVPPDAVAKIFQANPTKLPAFVSGIGGNGGYSIYKIVKVIDAPAPDTGRVALASSRVGSEIGRELMTAYLGSLKAGADVKINQTALEKKAQ